ncbi:MAG: uncharacterized protein QG632_879 [Candidatus Dependentiae bacterium]|nr:uncharacterized protein [Candidatus Dependentiae bacterium]
MKRRSLLLLLLLACGLSQDSLSTRQPDASLSLSHKKKDASKSKLFWLQKADEYQAPTTLPTTITMETLFGPLEITEPLLIELVAHPVLERLKDVDQHGPATHFGKWPSWSRYDHSIGVFALLYIYKCPLVEQVAGLLHDVSHTAFSHSADHLFKTGNEHSYQDSIHNEYLERMGLRPLLARYGLTIEEINPDRLEFTGLEQKNPILCADRIHYNFHAGLVHGHITQEQIYEMTESLHFENGKWFFDNQEHAQKLADIALHYCEHSLAPAANLVWHHWLCNALRRAATLGLVNAEEIHFGTDSYILAKLEASQDPYIREMLTKCRMPLNNYCIIDDASAADLVDYPKLRAIDPLVKLPGEAEELVLTMRNGDYQAAMEGLREKLKAGIKVRFL